MLDFFLFLLDVFPSVHFPTSSNISSIPQNLMCYIFIHLKYLKFSLWFILYKLVHHVLFSFQVPDDFSNFYT